MELLSNNEKQFIQTSLQQSLRIDGRSLFEFRNLSINFSQTRGQVEVALGDSLVFCVTEVTLDHPYPDRPNEGFLSFSVNYLPMAHPNFEQCLGWNLSQKHRRFKNDISQNIERLLEKTIKRSRALNCESLCIVSGKYAWHVNVYLHVLADHGNLTDLSVQACVISLLHARIPDIKINPDRSIEPLNIWKPLSLHFLPVCISFGFIDGIGFIDPEGKEESMLEGKVLICMNIYGDILALQKSGYNGIEQGVVFQCFEIALLKVKEITKHIRSVLDLCKDFEVGDEKNKERVELMMEGLN